MVLFQLHQILRKLAAAAGATNTALSTLCLRLGWAECISRRRCWSGAVLTGGARQAALPPRQRLPPVRSGELLRHVRRDPTVTFRGHSEGLVLACNLRRRDIHRSDPREDEVQKRASNEPCDDFDSGEGGSRVMGCHRRRN